MNENSRGQARMSSGLKGAAKLGIFERPVAAHRMMAAIIVVMLIASWFWGERVSVNDGLGWDGVTYATLVRDIGNDSFLSTLGTYYAQRILPSFVVRQSLLLFNSDFSIQSIITAFAIMNGILCVIITDLWRRIGDALSLSVLGRWIGFMGLFMNFEFSKQTMFYPVLTDPVALFLAALLFLLFLNRNRLGLIAVSIAGAFCWPTIAITGAIMCLLMPYRYDRNTPLAGPPAHWFELHYQRAFAAIALVAVLALLLASPPLHGICRQGLGTFDLFNYLPGALARKFQTSQSLRDPCLLAQQAITAIPSFLLMTLGILVLLTPLLRGQVQRQASWGYVGSSVLCAALIMVISSLGVRLISNPAVANPSSILLLARLSLLPPVGKVFLPFVTLVSFWGVILLYAIVAWGKVAAEANKLGFAIVGVLCFTIPFGLVGEPRFITTVWPILISLAAILLEQPHTKRFYAILIAASFLLAQFWLPINILPWPSGVFLKLEKFPKQLFFMHYGLWMGWLAYGMQAVVFGGIGWLLLRSMRRHISRVPDTGSDSGTVLR